VDITTVCLGEGKMSKKIFSIKLLVLINSIMVFTGYILSDIAYWPNNKIKERPMRAEVVLKIGSNKVNEDFYKLNSFTVDKKGQIYILDAGNSRIQCFSKEGKFLFGFGRHGQGPGELSNDASKIKILSDGNIYVIDNLPRRINVYNLEGKFLFSGNTSLYYNDIELLNNTYYLSSIILEENHKPIHVSRTLGKIDDEFGIFVEPAVGLLQQIRRLPNPEPWRYSYSDSNFTKLVVTNTNEIIFSQDFPYRLIKYDTKGQVLKDIMGDVDFDTYAHVKFTVGKDSSVFATSSKPARILAVSIKNDNRVVVPYLDPGKNFFYIDIYDLDLNLISRYKMPNMIANARKEEYIGQLMVDNDNCLYATVKSRENYPQLVKCKLIFD
jgi:hypothetical protein